MAAIDLGSNSFHLVIARVRGEEVSMLDRVRDPVQLARGLGRHGRLTKKTRERALRALERFGQRVRDLPDEQVRAVGTSTLRAVHDGGAFLAEAQGVLGHPIEIVSGHEEARLIYLGVAHSLADERGLRLVLDIGGGSTECILGERFEALQVHSLHLGCVRLSRECFPKGRITRGAFEAARLRAEGEIRTIERAFREAGWTEAVGASGTIRSAEAVLRAQGWSRAGITPRGLGRLRKALLAAGDVGKLRLEGLRSDRAAVFPGGVAILSALVDRLGISSLTAASGALREGVVYDLLGRIRHEDVRERTIRTFQERTRVDLAQAARVERTALALLSHAPAAWALDPAEDGRLLAWAARLHEVGLAVAWSHHHRHGAYLLRNAEMPGFSRRDQARLAALVACHRRRIDPAVLEALPEEDATTVGRLIVLLRLAVLLHRARSPEALPPFRLEGGPVRLRFRAPARWLTRQPLTRLDLDAERGYLRALGLEFAVVQAQAAGDSRRGPPGTGRLGSGGR